MLAPNKDYVDLSKPSIEGLIYALRHPEVWPKGFEFDFRFCSKCAMGLAHAMWPQEISYPLDHCVAKALGLDRHVAFDIFVIGWMGSPKTRIEIADALESRCLTKERV